jgi:hypothetical protein
MTPRIHGREPLNRQLDGMDNVAVVLPIQQRHDLKSRGKNEFTFGKTF